MWAFRVVPVHSSERGKLEMIDRFPWPLLGGPAYKLGLVITVYAFGVCIVETIAHSSHRGCRTDLGQTLAVANGCELRARIHVTSQFR